MKSVSLKQRLMLLLAFGLLASIGNFAFADLIGGLPIDEAFGFVTVSNPNNDLSKEIPVSVDFNSGKFIFGLSATPVDLDGDGTSEAQVSLGANGDPDPFIGWSFSATNSAAVPLAFGFALEMPIVFPYEDVASFGSISSSFTEGTAGNGVTITPVAPPALVPQDGPDNGPLPDEMAVYTKRRTADGALVNMKVDGGTAYFTGPLKPAASALGVPSNNSAVVLGMGPYSTMRVDVNFLLSGNGDRATLNGAEINSPIPEPSTIFLLGAGLLGLGLASWRRKPHG